MVKLATTKIKSDVQINDFLQYIKGLIVSLIVSFALILLFALIIKLTNLSDAWIVPINLVIKAISVILGVVIYAKSKSGGLKKGLIMAISYTTLAFVVFSAISGSFAIGWELLLDYLFTSLVGIIVGVIKVNTK